MRSACATRSASASKAITSASATPSRWPCSVHRQLRESAMTAADKINRGASGARLERLQHCACNVGAALMTLVRPVRVRPRPAWAPDLRKLAISAAIAVAIFLFGMFFIDAAASNAAKRLPLWLISFFDEITDFGKSGWFLWPLGILFVALAALPHSLLSRMSQR